MMPLRNLATWEKETGDQERLGHKTRIAPTIKWNEKSRVHRCRKFQNCLDKNNEGTK